MKNKILKVFGCGYQTLTIGYLMLALVYIAFSSLLWAAIYLGLIVFAIFVLAYFRCSKCPSRFTICTHGFYGYVTKLFKPRKTETYTLMDEFATIFYLLCLHVYPIHWIKANIVISIIFWGCAMFVFLMATFTHCGHCENSLCGSNRNKIFKKRK